MESVEIQPLGKPFDLVFVPPGSKSLTNRAMVLAALSTGKCTLHHSLFADDTLVMIDGLRKLGFEVVADPNKLTIQIIGCGGNVPNPSANLFCGNSGTTIRFLTALCAMGHGIYTLDGIARMRQRPIGPLVVMLRNLGVRIEHIENDGYPPVRILADKLPGGIVQYGSETSSQYLTSVLQIAPYARNEMVIDLQGKQTSWPYVSMTMQLMDTFGVTCELYIDPDTHEPRQITIPQGNYNLSDYHVEPDASNATYSLALAAIHESSKITINNLGRHSLQGDVQFANVLKQMGAFVQMDKNVTTVQGTDTLEGIDVDLSNMPDTAQTLAVVALFAKGSTTIRGLHTLRVKETDRLEALRAELGKLGATVNIENNTLHITPPNKITPTNINTYDDHRMAMSFALAGTKAQGVIINDPQCVNKTYPNYFKDLKLFGVGVK